MRQELSELRRVLRVKNPEVDIIPLVRLDWRRALLRSWLRGGLRQEVMGAWMLLRGNILLPEMLIR